MKFILLLRVKQWIKNGFVLAPLLFSGEFLNPEQFVSALLAMLIFCIASSATYIVNDLFDIEQDRKHPKKSKTRPLASGAVSKQQAYYLLGFLYLLLITAYFVQPAVICVVLIYLIINFFYTLYLKHQPVIDIFTIATGFVLRVYAGAVALSVPPSSWMLVTTLNLALFLAAIKRRQELISNDDLSRRVLEHYSIKLIERYAEMAATGSLIFYGLFVMTVRPELIYTIFFVIFGLFRYWYIVEKLDLGESPTEALLSDIQLSLAVMLWIAATIWAIYI